MSMDRVDVLVIGGGPAGSTCAWQLRRSGLDVAVLDKRAFPRDKVCAGWITPAVVEALEMDLDDYGRERTLQPLTGFRIGMMGRPEAEVRYDEPVSYGIRRCEFDHYLLMRSGARLFLGEACDDMRRDADGNWVVNGHIRAPLVIGAGGHFCPVARLLGARPGSAEAAVLAKETEFEMTPEQGRDCGIRADVPELFFCEDLKGYGWVFRKGNWLNIGLGRQDSHRLGHHLDVFLDMLTRTGRIPSPVPGGFQGHAYLLYGDTPRRIVDDGVLLVGDAAGLAYVQSGEGIRPAIESALLAASVVAQCRAGFDSDQLQPYADRLVQRFGPRDRRVAAAVTTGLPARVKRSLAARLLASQWFVRHWVLNRWFFHRDQPRLQV
nr:NAD(P)/FAD-dependent oxidoreductase [Thioalkalivibrio sp.]